MTPVPDRVRWHEDMLVTPTHLDQLSQRVEALVRAVPTRSGPFGWGILSQHIVIEDGRVALGHVEAIMPNGLYVSFSDEGHRLAVAPPPNTERARVYLSAPVEGGPSPSTGSPRRFVADPGGDGWIGDDGLPIERMRGQVQLHVGQPPSDDRLTSLPVAEIRGDRQGLALTDYVPPMIALPPEHPLVTQCAAVASRLRREVDVLALRTIENAPLPFRAELRAQINPMIAALPPFEVLFAAQPHPFILYIELCRVAAAVAALRDRVAPPTFPTYLHEDIRASFDAAFRFITGAPAPTLTQATASFPFERDGAWFRLPPAQVWTEALSPESPAQLVLAMQADTTDALAMQWGEQCVIASRGVIQSLLARRVLGLGRQRIQAVGGVPVERDVFLFLLERNPALARAGEDLLILGDMPALKPAAVTLHVVAQERSR